MPELDGIINYMFKLGPYWGQGSVMVTQGPALGSVHCWLQWSWFESKLWTLFSIRLASIKLCVLTNLHSKVFLERYIQMTQIPNRMGLKKKKRRSLMKLEPHDLNKILRWHFSQILKMLIRWRHSRHFICFRMRHSHGRNFASILFKFIDKKG